MDKSGEPYSGHRDDVDALETRLSAAYEFSAGTPYNGESTVLWQTLLDPQSQLAVSYFDYWEEHGRVSAAYWRNMRVQVAEAFDTIICLEANKQKASRCATGQ